VRHEAVAAVEHGDLAGPEASRVGRLQEHDIARPEQRLQAVARQPDGHPSPAPERANQEVPGQARSGRRVGSVHGPASLFRRATARARRFAHSSAGALVSFYRTSPAPDNCFRPDLHKGAQTRPLDTLLMAPGGDLRRTAWSWRMMPVRRRFLVDAALAGHQTPARPAGSRAGRTQEANMGDCEMLKGCIFFNDKMADYPTTAEFLKKKYCMEDNSECARYIVCKALGRERVPKDLFPNSIDRARALISAA
jgi:hypothetical protein